MKVVRGLGEISRCIFSSGGVALALALALFAGQATLSSAQSKPRLARAVSTPFGFPAEIEVLEATAVDVDTLISDAFERIRVIERYTERAVTDQLSYDSAPAPTNTARDLFHILQRAKDFCEWSEGALSPLSGRIYDLWTNATSLPRPDTTKDAVESAECERIRLNPEGEMVQVFAGSQIDLRDFAPGYAVDAAMDLLEEGGVTNARVQIGTIHRAIGPGRTGKGWEIPIPQFTHLTEPLKPVLLLDQALSIAGIRPYVSIAGDQYNSYFDARRGIPSSGVISVLTVTDHALDAQGLSTALYIIGNHHGEMRLGVLKPSPSVLWLLGSSQSAPLIGTYHWTRR